MYYKSYSMEISDLVAEMGDDPPIAASDAILRYFRDKIRGIFGHSVDNENQKSIFNRAWKLDKSSWKTLANSYYIITKQMLPETILNNELVVKSIVEEVDRFIEDPEFRNIPKDTRQKIFYNYVKERTKFANCPPGSYNAVIEGILDHYEQKFNTTLKSLHSPNNPVDTVTMDIPLLIRMLEWAREDSQSDQELHQAAETMIALSQKTRTLTMSNYDDIVRVKNEAIINIKRLAGLV